jgi:hypothetical protein
LSHFFDTMSSGMGAYNGSEAQCFRFWTAFKDCRVRARITLCSQLERALAGRGRPRLTPFTRNGATVGLLSLAAAPSARPSQQSTASHPVQCSLELMDYDECLHRHQLKRRIAAKLLAAHERSEAIKHPKAEGHGHGH